MARSRKTRRVRQSCYRSSLVDSINTLIDPKVVQDIPFKGRYWTPWRLVWMAILMAWEQAPTLAGKFDSARIVLKEVFPRTKLGRTYQGFIKALLLVGVPLLDRLSDHLRAGLPALAGPYWQCQGWCALAVDGSRVECPRTAANEGALGCAGKNKTTPQLFLTTVYHMGSGLPWSYRIGPGTDSERDHLGRMLGLLPVESLLVADAGFVGYDLLDSIVRGGRHFLIRVGSNVTLLKRLGYGRICRDDIVFLWPQKAAKHRQPPLVLRLITLHDGRKPVCLVTNVSDAQRLSDSQASSLYRRRWGVEVFYRSFKQTLGHRKMRSDAPQQAYCELGWAMMGLWLLSALAVKQIVTCGEDPLRLSVAEALKVVRLAMRLIHRPGRSGWLLKRWAQAVKDRYLRTADKKARDWPHKKKDKPPGQPKIRLATRKEVRWAQDLEVTYAAA